MQADSKSSSKMPAAQTVATTEGAFAPDAPGLRRVADGDDVGLEINSNSNIEKLVNYWAAGGRAKDIEPLLTSLWRTPGHPSWMFMKMADLLELYEGTFQSEGPLQVMYYRKRAD